MHTIKHWLTTATAQIPSDDAQIIAETLLAKRFGKNRAYLQVFPETQLPETLSEQLQRDLARLADSYPLAYVLGKQGFWDMELTVNEATLIPRADTETLIEIAQTLFDAETTATMIDLGTGSGAIAIALSRIFPHACLTATDISDAALAVAKANAAEWQIAPITFIRTAWLDGFAPQSFDLIATNPPYIAEGDPHLPALSYEPITALTAPKNGLADIETIISQAKIALKTGGWLLLEHGYDQGQAVRGGLANTHWQAVTTHRDLGGNERITVAQRRPIE